MATKTSKKSGTKRSTTSRSSTGPAKKASKRSSSKSSSKSKEVLDGGAIANNRAAAGRKGQGVQGGLVDQMTRRKGDDAVEGGMVYVDRTHSDLSDDVQELLGGLDGYGVYTEPAEVDEGGFPKTVVVLLRNSGQRIVVPYDACRPVDLTERRP